MSKTFSLQGKTAAVIGGSGHLCSTLSKALSEAGARVAVLDMSEPAYEPDLYLSCDAVLREDLKRCRDEIIRKFGRVDILLNGAGTNAPTPFLNITPEEIQKILTVNFTAVVYACQIFGEPMLAQRSGSIINFASVSSGPPLSKAFIYSAAKAALANITQNLAREWAPYNVRVNALKPGFFPTEWSMKNFIDEERKNKIFSHTPMGRFGKPEELAGAVLWLASDAASFVTGSIVSVDGGFTAMTI